MSDPIKHECGVVLLRLRKPLQYYIEKYGTLPTRFGKCTSSCKKQHNRGQDGVGIANIKLDMTPGTRYISRYRTVDSSQLRIFSQDFQKNTERPKRRERTITTMLNG